MAQVYLNFLLLLKAPCPSKTIITNSKTNLAHQP
jgi:hypothetical protein